MRKLAMIPLIVTMLSMTFILSGCLSDPAPDGIYNATCKSCKTEMTQIRREPFAQDYVMIGDMMHWGSDLRGVIKKCPNCNAPMQEGEWKRDDSL